MISFSIKEKKMKQLNLVSSVVNGKIDTNYNQFLKDLESMVEPYRGLIFTDDQMVEAKKTVAELNKVRTAIDTRKKAIKKDFMAPYMAFEIKVKKAIGIIDDALAPLKKQLRDAEEVRVIEKKRQVDNIIQDALQFNESSSYILDCKWFYNEKWNLKGTSLKKVKEEVDSLIETIEGNIDVLSQDEFATELLSEYQKNGNITTTLLLKERLIAQREQAKELAELKKRTPDPEPESVPEPVYKSVPKFVLDELEMTITCSLTGTKSQMVALKAFCDSQGIVIQRI